MKCDVLRAFSGGRRIATMLQSCEAHTFVIRETCWAAAPGPNAFTVAGRATTLSTHVGCCSSNYFVPVV